MSATFEPTERIPRGIDAQVSIAAAIDAESWWFGAGARPS